MYFKKLYPSKSIISILFLSIIIFHACTPSEMFLLRQRQRNQLDSKTIRVLVLSTKNLITINSKSGIEIKDKKTEAIKYSGNNRNIKIKPEKINNDISIKASNDIVYLNNTGYRGSLEIRNREGALNIINILSMEEYLYSVVPGEIPAVWPEEALKAQAVAARTYAMHHIMNQKIKNDFDLDATTNFQVYKGICVEDNRTTEAVKMTAGEILETDNKPIVAYFHSTCGGKTADDRFVWQDNDLNYLKEVTCGFCEDSPSYSWETILPLAKIEYYVKTLDSRVVKINNISFKKRSGRVISVIIKHRNGTLELSGNQFRMLFPPKTLLSLYFIATKSGRGIKITGKGWGHGVGLCQYGAKGMANKGYNYKKILLHYYPGVSFAQIHQIDERYFAGK